MSTSAETPTATTSPARFVGEGVLLPSAYQFRPWTAQTVAAVALVAVMAGAAVVLDQLAIAAVLGVLALIAVSSRVIPELTYARARRAGHDFTQRFEIGDEGIFHAWHRPDGTQQEKTYDWFLFEHCHEDPHRLILWLRVPTRPGGLPEVLLVPRSLFEDDFAALTALVLTHVPKRVTTLPKPAPRAQWKTIALWIVLVGLLTAVYYVLRAPGG